MFTVIKTFMHENVFKISAVPHAITTSNKHSTFVAVRHVHISITAKSSCFRISEQQQLMSQAHSELEDRGVSLFSYSGPFAIQYPSTGCSTPCSQQWRERGRPKLKPDFHYSS